MPLTFFHKSNAAVSVDDQARAVFTEVDNTYRGVINIKRRASMYLGEGQLRWTASQHHHIRNRVNHSCQSASMCRPTMHSNNNPRRRVWTKMSDRVPTRCVVYRTIFCTLVRIGTSRAVGWFSRIHPDGQCV